MNKLKLFAIVCVSFFFSTNLLGQDFGTLQSEADLAFMDGKFSEALEQYQQLMEMGTEDSSDLAMVYSYAALSSEQLNKNDAALDYYAKALELNVPQLMIYDKMISLAKAEDDDTAYEFALLKKLEEFPDFQAEIIQKLAYHYYNTRQYKKLLEQTKILTEWYPDNAKFILFDAVAKQNTGDTEAAKVAYKKVLELDPDNASANMGLGMIIYKKATAIYDKMKENYESLSNPDRVDYSNYRKKLEEPKAMYKEAIPLLKKAYENPAYSTLKGALRNSYMRIENKEEADKYL